MYKREDEENENKMVWAHEKMEEETYKKGRKKVIRSMKKRMTKNKRKYELTKSLER